MAIYVSLRLKDDERQLLSGILGCRKADLERELKPYAKAALEEYVRMILGQHVFTRGQDLKEYRLFLLIKDVFKNKIPDDQKVSDLFQTTPTESRSLIRSVMSKYQYELKKAISQTLKEIVDSVQRGDESNEYIITLNSVSKVEELNHILVSIDGTLPQISKKKGAVSTYVVRRSSYVKLCEHFRLAPMPEEE